MDIQPPPDKYTGCHHDHAREENDHNFSCPRSERQLSPTDLPYVNRGGF